MITCKVCGQPNESLAASCSRCNARLTIAPRQCANGHILEPGATECVYCRNETALSPPSGAAGGRGRTEVANFPAAPQGGPGVYAPRPPGAPRAAPPPPGDRRTVAEPFPPAGPVAGRPAMPPPAALPPLAPRPAMPPPGAPIAGGPVPPPATPQANSPAAPPPRKTQFYSTEDQQAPGAAPGAQAVHAPVPAAPGRRIVGVLVTYSWRPEGQIFPIYEGRNVIGRGGECEVSVPHDGSLSERNSHISYQQRFVVGDLVSMSGTFLNGDAVLSQFEALPDTATLRTGSTTWLFVNLLQYGTPQP